MKKNIKKSKRCQVWMQLHPDQRQALESPVTIVKRIEQAAQYPVRSGLANSTLHQISFDLFDQIRILKIRRKSQVPLEAVPYSEEYKDHLSKSADFLKEVKQFSALRLVLILIFSFIIMCSPLSRFPLLHFMFPSPGCGQDGQPFAGQVSQSTSSGTFSSLIDCLDGFFACFCLSLCGFSQVCN